MHRGRRHTAVRGGAALLAGLLLLPALASCSSDRAARRPSNDIGAAPRSQVLEGGTLRWAVGEVPSTFNAFQADAGEDTARVTGAVLPSMFTIDSRGGPRINPDYLESAEVTAREPHQVVVYRINPDAVWTDGRPVTAADFTAQWKALSGADASFWPARNDGYRQIEKVERGRDEYEVEVTFARPYADWRMLFTPLYPKSATGTPEAFNDGSRERLTATAGPFRVKAVDREGAKRSVTLVRNARWWGERARLDRIVLTPVPDDARVAALREGRVDVAELEPGPAAARRDRAAHDPVARARAVSGVKVRRGVDSAFTQLTLNGADGPLADEQVRRAVARAIDRRALARIALEPLGLPVRTLGNHLVMAHQTGYEDNSSALGGHDVRSAESLLAKAGWRPGEVRPERSASPSAAAAPPVAAPPGETSPDPAAARPEVRVVEPATLRVREGRPLSLRLLVPEEAATMGAIADRVASMLSAVGVRTEITRVGDDSFFRDHVAAGEFDLALFSWPGTAYPATDDRPIYAKPLPAPDGSLIVEQNYARVGTDEIDQLFEQASAELDPEAARGLADRADARIWAAAHSLPLFQRPQAVAVRGSVANVGAFGFLTPRYQDIGFTERPRA